MKCTPTKRRQLVVRVWVHAHVRVFVVWSDSLFDSTRICVELGLKGLESGPFDSGVHIQVETKASTLFSSLSMLGGEERHCLKCVSC